MERHAPLIAQLQQQGYRDRWVAETHGLRALGANRLVAPEDLVVDRQWGHGRGSLFALRDPVDDHAGFFTSAREGSQRDAAMVARLEGEAPPPADDPTASAAASRGEPQNARIVELEAALAKSDDKLRAAVALYDKVKTEFPAAKARIEREAKNELNTWKDGFLSGFLEVMDDVDRALSAAEADAVTPAVAEGLELVASRFLAKLRAQGVEPIAAPQHFDPNFHEAIAATPVHQQQDDGAIIEVIARGYMRNDKVLRPTRVVVGKFSPAHA